MSITTAVEAIEFLRNISVPCMFWDITKLSDDEAIDLANDINSLMKER
ncbi:MAG: hypothetical protein ACRCX2_32470 [Paraclostridium sp.]